MDSNSNNVYVNVDALSGWKLSLDSLNEGCISSLESFKKTVSELEDAWQGVASSSFRFKVKKFVDEGIEIHNKMYNLNQTLENVATTMRKQ